jgi:hypothetical protein
MNTEDLISALVADNPTRERRLGRSFAWALLAGMAMSGVIFVLWIHPRRDLTETAATVRVLLKFAFSSLLGFAAFGLAVRMARPGAPLGFWRVAPLVGPALLIIGVIGELYVVPTGLWSTRLIGANARFCLVLIPMLALGPLAAMLWALKQAAPTQPVLAGAVAGLAAGGIAAMLYAAHCTDDSPLFVATWYSLAVCLVAAAGAFAGSRLLRW